MKTQISRRSFRPAQRYSGVQLQQGRMIVDADWNEQSDIFDYRQVSTLADVVASGAPVNGGLALIGTAAAPLLRPGRVYVEGVAAVLPADVDDHWHEIWSEFTAGVGS